MMPAVGYLRRSTTKQEQSIEGQREAIAKHAEAQGYNLIRFYTDDGISGATGGERPQFQQMLRDAERLRDFQVVVCYDLSRFGRMDSDETGYWRYLLRKAGVRIVFSNENDGGDGETGDIVRPVMQAQKRQLLKQISRDTARGMVQSVRDGWITGRAAPFGLDRMLVDEHGQPRRRLKRGEAVEKPRSWHVTLTHSDDPREVEALKWIFGGYVRNEIGCSAIAARLNERGIPAPHGGLWAITTIRAIIKNPVYKGDVVFGRKSEGRFHRIIGGEVQPVPVGEGKVVRRSLDQCVVRHDPDVALVTAELWEAANRKLAARGNRQVGARARRQAYALSGLVRCGDCGALMSGVPQFNKTNRVRLYTCSSHFRYHRCHRNSVCEDRLLPVLRNVMLDRLFCGGDMERLRAAILRKLEARADDGREQRLKGELAKAKADMERAARNLLLADPANVPFLNQGMTELRERVKTLEDDLAACRRQGDAATIAEEIVGQARTLVGELFNGAHERMKAILGELVERIELRFEPAAWGRRTVRRVAGCDLYLRDSLTTYGRGGGI